MKRPILYFPQNILLGFCILMITVKMSSGSDLSKCWPSEMGESFPDSVSKEEVYRVTGISPTTCLTNMAKWPYGDSLFIVYSEDTSHYSIHFLKKNTHSFQELAKYQSGLNAYRFYGFDLAPYKLNKNETALGIRFFARGPTNGGGWECKMLRLFEFRDRALHHIFSTIVDYATEGNADGYDTGRSAGDGGSAIVIIGKPDKSGYNRLITKTGKSKSVFTYKNGEYSIDETANCLGAKRCFCPDNSSDSEPEVPLIHNSSNDNW